MSLKNCRVTNHLTIMSGFAVISDLTMHVEIGAVGEGASCLT